MNKTLSSIVVIAFTAILAFTACKKKNNENPENPGTPTPVLQTVSAPAFSIPAGTYHTELNIELSCATDGASMFYTTDGTDPNNESSKYTTGITVNESTLLKAIACKDGWNNSTITQVQYNIVLDTVPPVIEQVKTPSITPESCTFTDEVFAIFVCSTPQASIYYTTDGSEPDTTSTLYTVPITFTETVIVNVKAFKKGMIPSETVSAKYTKEPEKVKTPEFIVPGGVYNEAINVAIRCMTEGASIFYTLDGTTPTTSSTLYTVSFKLNESATVKAIAYKEGAGYSEVAEVRYDIIILKVKNPEFSIPGGTFNMPVSRLELSCKTSGAAIHFTINGEDPTESSPQYSQPISFSETTTVKARAFKSGHEPSDIVEATYIIEVICEGKITISDNSGAPTEYTITSVSKKDARTIAINADDVNMTLVFNRYKTGTFNFPEYEGDPNATCTANLQTPNALWNFFNGGSITVAIDPDSGINTITFTNVTATAAIGGATKTVSLDFYGSVF